MTSLQSYLTSVLGIKMSFPKTASEELLRASNSSFSANYNFYEIFLSRTRVVVAQRLNPEGINGSNLAKEYREMKDYFSFLLILEITVNDATLRRQLIGKKVNFVVPGHQLFFPELYISLIESNELKRSSTKMLTISAQVVLLYHLQKMSLAGMPFKQIAEHIGYSAKTVSLIVEELCKFGIAKVISDGHNKTLQFFKRGRELYEEVDRWLQSPVMASGHTDRDVSKMGPVQVGLSALNHAYSEIPQYRKYGISSKAAKLSNLRLYATDRKYSVEIWKYDPALMATDGYAYILSVLLSQIETLEGYTYRYNYNQSKKSVLEKVKWADTEVSH